MKDLPKKYKHAEVEKKWIENWDKQLVYQWDSSASREDSFVVDTPPPTVSGSLHVGHVFSYTHTDVIVRYQRMLGKNIMYPMGWDDNGLPTERRVQNKFNITCNPKLPYQSDWTVSKNKKRLEVSRQNFIEACQVVTEEDEKAFEELWKSLGLSVDWSQQYSTIGDHCREISQKSFADLASKELVYSIEAPTMWDVTYKTALAQADVEDRDMPGAYHDIKFEIEEDNSHFVISTTRPELLAACIAVVAHPDDERYQSYFGKYAISPLFKAKVPILASSHAEPDKGTGILMVCTFGDSADVDWWKQSGLPIKQIINKGGRFKEVDFTQGVFKSLAPSQADINYQHLVGKKVKQARPAIVELLKEQNLLVGEPKAITHPVKFYEKGDEPLEFVSARQWFVNILDHKKELLEQGNKISWHPEFMKHRYDNWVEGLNFDWCISRQRFFGVPFPLWYKIDAEGEVDYENPIIATSFPVDPLSETAPGFEESQRGLPGGFCGDPDVMDTWATSSLTPQIVSNWGSDKHEKVFPADIRPQSHEIIRTWAFYTIAKSYFHEKKIPWKSVVISGWILDPDRKKMSKSKGNVVVPNALLESYSSDAVRYWAARARLGTDTAYDESVFKIGVKLRTKIFNASKFVLSNIASNTAGSTAEVQKSDLVFSNVVNTLDLSFLSLLDESIKASTKALNAFDYAQALQEIETTFWTFCDSYLELVKTRAYQGEGKDKLSALSSLNLILNSFLKLFAPYMPFVTEEVWSWLENEKSIHLSSWPKASASKTEFDYFNLARKVLASIHHAKSSNQKNLKWPVSKLIISADKKTLSIIEQISNDIILAGKVEEIEYLESGKELEIEVVLKESAD